MSPTPAMPQADLPSDVLIEATELARRVNQRLARITTPRPGSLVEQSAKNRSDQTLR